MEEVLGSLQDEFVQGHASQQLFTEIPQMVFSTTQDSLGNTVTNLFRSLDELEMEVIDWCIKDVRGFHPGG